MKCSECEYWTQGLYPIVGECQIDMEGKMANEGCERGKSDIEAEVSND